MATQIIKSNETSHVQVPMHHRMYTSTEAMTTAYTTIIRGIYIEMLLAYVMM